MCERIPIIQTCLVQKPLGAFNSRRRLTLTVWFLPKVFQVVVQHINQHQPIAAQKAVLAAHITRTHLKTHRHTLLCTKLPSVYTKVTGVCIDSDWLKKVLLILLLQGSQADEFMFPQIWRHQSSTSQDSWSWHNSENTRPVLFKKDGGR